ncbi:transcription initiation factor IIB [Halosimplex rubrum]|uniref:Transcription initiation factor IIB n=1 Tax=Halosimplex rubrum TaxID=869889 RepID=A0A7D5P574_9EURY|nr:transcription initiation factor IIB [Halosimplex rubrum]QLH77802.1 transcription initiation factor IIB [Halosimplex rubrum]
MTSTNQRVTGRHVQPIEHTDEETDRESKSERERDECPECGAAGITDEKRGETVCRECGVVLEEDVVDRGPEWRSFDARDKAQKSRVGSPTTEMLHDKGLSSVIDWQNKDANGQTLSAKKREQMSRLRTWDERFRSQSAQDRNLKQALGEIDRMASALGIPKDARETASVIYRRALDEELIPGRSIEAMATGSLYAGARQAGVPRTLDELETVSRVDRKEFARAYRYIARELELAMEPTDPAQYVPRLVSDLDLPEETKQRAVELLEAGKREAVHSGKNPVGLAAAAIYAAGRLTNVEVTQHEVADAADVSAVTIRDRYTELLDADDRAA